MTETLELFKGFMDDKEAGECYLTGVAGTGKTTSLGELLQWCIDNKITAVTTAYTHQACSVLAKKLPTEAIICTLHSYLTKRPTINDKATQVKHVDKNTQMGIPQTTDVLFIDEFSMVGEKDYVDISALQYDEEGDLITKVVYIGDPNQLPPVKDQKAVEPRGKHWIKLTKIYRQANDNPLIDTLLNLNDYINGKDPAPLVEHSNLRRGVDIVKLYNECNTSKIILAYTNAQVQWLNAHIEGVDNPELYSEVYSPTLRRKYVLVSQSNSIDHIMNIQNKELKLNSKYRTLETLHTIVGVKFYQVENDEVGLSSRAAVFGHDNYLQLQKTLANTAVELNLKIKSDYSVEDPTAWAKENWKEPIAKERAAAWKKYLSFKENVICLDFPHAMTVHKSQGSTYENVFLDTEDMAKCSKHDYEMYLKLLYVAISRASKCVYTN